MSSGDTILEPSSMRTPSPSFARVAFDNVTLEERKRGSCPVLYLGADRHIDCAMGWEDIDTWLGH